MTLTLDDVLKLTGGELLTPAQQIPPRLIIDGVAALAEATAGEVAFFGNEKYYKDYLATKASVVLVPPGVPGQPHGVVLVQTENPSLAFNALVDAFMKVSGVFEPSVHPTAIVHSDAKVCGARIQAGAIVEAGAVVGQGTDVGPGCVIGCHARIGEHCKLYARVVVRERCILGNYVVVQPGAVIGSDGFGFLLNKETGRYETVDQVGIVVVEDHVDIGANTTIDRARFGRTVIGEGTKIDNLVQIGHNVTLGKHNIIVAQSGIAGSTRLGDYVTVAAQCGIAGHLHVGDKAVMGARTGVMSNLQPDQVYWGSPAVLAVDARRQVAALRRLPSALKTMYSIKKHADELQDSIAGRKRRRFWPFFSKLNKDGSE